jgi:hypothetical protein
MSDVNKKKTGVAFEEYKKNTRAVDTLSSSHDFFKDLLPKQNH